WQDQGLSDETLIALVVWIYRDRRIAEHRLWPRGSDGDPAVAFFERIANVVKLALLRLAQNFQIRKHRLIVRAPVNDPVAAIDHPVFVQPDERFAHRARKIFVHRERKSRPID